MPSLGGVATPNIRVSNGPLFGRPAHVVFILGGAFIVRLLAAYVRADDDGRAVRVRP